MHLGKKLILRVIKTHKASPWK